MSLKHVVAITGCDSGLGWAIAARSAREGLITVAGLYGGTETKAAQALKKLCAHAYPLDVTNPDSVTHFRNYVQTLLKNNSEYKLYAIINNAGVMTIGDYEWQTPKIIENTINVNLLGAMRVTSAFLPDLRRSAIENNVQPRIINITSHCGLQPLPGFGPYCASKAGLLAWTEALRLEQKPHGLTTVAFIPGGFVESSNLLIKQTDHGSAMLENLNEEQKTFYQKRISILLDYLQAGVRNPNYDSMKNENIIDSLFKALTEKNPKQLYKVESWRYWYYYNLFKLPFPEWLYHWLIKRFLNFPAVDSERS